MKPLFTWSDQTGICSGLVLAALLLAGCAGDPDPDVFARAQVFCYRTLAEVECFPAPVPGEESRFTGTAWSGPHRLPLVVSPAPRTGPS